MSIFGKKLMTASLIRTSPKDLKLDLKFHPDVSDDEAAYLMRRIRDAADAWLANGTTETTSRSDK